VKNTILLLFAGLLFTSPVLAQEKIIISGITGSRSSQLCIATVREAYKRIGYEIEIQRFNGKTALKKSNSGEVDAELQRVDGISRKYSNLIQVPIPINFLRGTAFATKVSFPVTGWYSLKPYKIGIPKGILFAEQGTEGMNPIVADSYQGVLDKLDSGEVDVIVLPQINGRLAIKEGKVKGLKELEGILEQVFAYHYVHKKNESLVPRLEKVLKQMLLDGTIKRLRDESYAKLLAGG
jgi:polar amino acid transport system substrate-binding protein